MVSSFASSIPPPTTHSAMGFTSSWIIEWLIVFTIRLVFFRVCLYYVDYSLLSGLRAVIHQDLAVVEPEIVVDLQKEFTQNFSPPPSPKLGSKGKSVAIYTRLAGTVFCICFTECLILFSLVLFGEILNERSRFLQWSFSLVALLSLIVFIVPFGLCFLITHRTRIKSSTRLVLTLLPFGIYLFIFHKLGSWLLKNSITEGTHSIDYLNDLLGLVCGPGVILLASLSGAGAISTAFDAWIWRNISNADLVKDTQIVAAEKALYRVRMDIHTRARTHLQLTSSLEHESDASRSLFSKLFSSSPTTLQINTLATEIATLESMESVMMRDLEFLKKRKQMKELGETFRGRLWLLVGWLFSLYCCWRVLVSCINLIFGYSRYGRHHHTVVDPNIPNTPHPEGTDLITFLLQKVAHGFNIHMDISAWSRLLGLLLIGSIILANLRNVLWVVSKVFKAALSGISASFMLLFLAELMSLYFITSLISLPAAPSESISFLLDTLPNFDVFSRLFDSVFLISGGVVFLVRYIQFKVQLEDGITNQY